jgi:hypothetical protein
MSLIASDEIQRLQRRVRELEAEAACAARMRPVIEELATTWDCGSPAMIRHFMERLGRAAHTTRVQDVEWLRSLATPVIPSPP